jgi:thymidylate synthase (FAD)
MSVKLIGRTVPVVDFGDRINIDTAEQLIVYMARVSNPESQQAGDNPERLLAYLVRHRHWSPFEMVSLTMEIQAPRDISRQILRHRSFSFQEFSQRYAEVTEFAARECRLQDQKNRQSSIECGEDDKLAAWWKRIQQQVIEQSQMIYDGAIASGIAREVARCILPEGLTMSRLYMHGTLRSWIHYCLVRMEPGTQKEHRQIAERCWEIVRQEFPAVVAAVDAESAILQKKDELFRAWKDSMIQGEVEQ